MSKLNTEVVVVGGELCGLCAAAIVAHGHKRVVVLDDEEPPDVLPLGDRLVPVAPTLWRFPQGGPAASVIDGLGLKQDARRVLGDPVGLGLIDDPDVRMAVPVDPTAREVELARVFGGVLPEGGAARLAQLLTELPLDARHKLVGEAAFLHQEGFFEKRRARKRQATLGREGDVEEMDPAVAALGEDGLGAALPALVPFVQALVEAPRGLSGWLAALPLAAGAQTSARGGLGPRHALKELLRGVIRGHGGEILTGERVTTVHVDGKAVARVETSGANDYQAKVIVDATTRRDLVERLPPSRRREKTLAAEARLVVAAEMASVRWLLHVSSLPRGIPPVALVLDDGRPFLVGVYAGLPPKDGNKAAAQDDPLVAVVAMTLAPPDQGERAADELNARLQRLMPFSYEQVRAADRIFGEGARGIHPLYQKGDADEHVLLGRRPSTGFANFFRAGRDLVPSLGIDGELVAARSVAVSVQQALGLKTEGATDAA